MQGSQVASFLHRKLGLALEGPTLRAFPQRLRNNINEVFIADSSRRSLSTPKHPAFASTIQRANSLHVVVDPGPGPLLTRRNPTISRIKSSCSSTKDNKPRCLTGRETQIAGEHSDVSYLKTISTLADP